MNPNIIKIGDKIEIKILQEVEQRRKTGEQAEGYSSKVQNIMEDGCIEVLVPTEGGKNVSLPKGVRLEFVFYTGHGMYRCICQIKDRYIKENLYVLLVEPRTPLEKFQRRDYYRFECVMDMQYQPITKEEAEIWDVQEIKEHHRLTYPEDLFQEAVAVDISGGGIRFITSQPVEKETFVVVSIRLENESMDHLLEVVGKVMICQQMERRDKEKKYEYRVQFLLRNPQEREKIIKYIFEQERKSRQKD